MITSRLNITCTIFICTIVCYSANVIQQTNNNHEDIVTFENMTELNRRKRDSNIRKF